MSERDEEIMADNRAMVDRKVYLNKPNTIAASNQRGVEMSVCNEGWSHLGREFCPAAITYGGDEMRVCGCWLKRWHEWHENEEKEPPNSCPHAPILKLLVEAKEVGGVDIYNPPMRLDKDGNDLSEGVTNIKFWIKR